MEYKLENVNLCITVSSMGAELQSIDANGQEYLWDGDETFWRERSPLLFPYVGRLTDGTYTYRGTSYSMNLHGFARSMEFHAEKVSPVCLKMTLRDSTATYAIYPFHFSLQVTYTLKEHTIQIAYEVKNESDETMYFGIGGHPGFALPFEKGLDFTDYYLEFPIKHVPTRIGFTKECFLSGQDTDFPLEEGCRLPLIHEMFHKDAIVLKHVPKSVTLKSNKGKRAVTVSYPGMSYVGFWHTPDTKAPYICIEPWASLPSRQGIREDLQLKGDLIPLKEHKIYRNEWEITIHAD